MRKGVHKQTGYSFFTDNQWALFGKSWSKKDSRDASEMPSNGEEV